MEFEEIKEYSSLCIIGNGFDREHGMSTGYEDFKQWLLVNDRFDVILELQKAFPVKKDNEYLLWSDFEKALGEYDIDTVVNWGWDSLYLTVDSLGKMAFNKKIIDIQLSDIIQEAFTMWVSNIQIADSPKYNLSRDALYFTFNYTDTLELLYKIPENQVLHIHGRVSKGDKLIVGHNREIDTLACHEESLCVNEQNERVQRLAEMNALRKPYQELIKQNEMYFKRMEGVSDVYVIGHSCATVDYPYFIKIANSVAHNTRWHFNPHTDEDYVRINNLKNLLGLA